MAEVTVAGREKSFSTAYQWYALGVLFVVYVFNFIDRSVLALLAQSIKEDLQISDTALGLLGGLAFAVFYTGLGIPIARLADKGNRRNILVVCLSIWSAATALCGLAQSYALPVAGAHRRRRRRSRRQSAVALDDLGHVSATPPRDRARHLCARHSGRHDDRRARRRLDQRRVRVGAPRSWSSVCPACCSR